jgi:hypothetical protein
MLRAFIVNGNNPQNACSNKEQIPAYCPSFKKVETHKIPRRKDFFANLVR